MKVALNECYVLHRRPFRESSLLVEIFSRQHGRLPLIHRGARRMNNKRNAIGPFQLFMFSWSGRGEIATMGSYEGVGPSILADSKDCMCGFYMNELLHRLLHRHEPHQELFVAYDACLRSMGMGTGKTHEMGKTHENEQQLRYFELELLSVLGYGPILDQDADGNALLPERQYRYLPERGPIADGDDSGAAVSISGATMGKLRQRQPLDSAGLSEAKNLMRSLLQQQMQGRGLASQHLYKSYLQAGNREAVRL